MRCFARFFFQKKKARKDLLFFKDSAGFPTDCGVLKSFAILNLVLLEVRSRLFRPIYDDDDHNGLTVCQCSDSVIPVICGIFYSVSRV